MQTTSPDNLPKKCRECVKSSHSFIDDSCNFCLDLGYHEKIFCDLNRCEQNSKSFECNAFQPILKLVGASRPKDLIFSQSRPQDSLKKVFQELLESDKVKYQRALARQKIARAPDIVFMDIKYHFAWNVISRKSAFKKANHIFDPVSNIFSACGEQINCIVSLLWLAPDHLHLYVDADVEQSPETIAQEIKKNSTAPILAELAKLGVSLNKEKKLWDQTYFVETVG